jgi:hypothetical protein
MVEKTLQNDLIFFSTLTVMSNKCQFVFLNGNIYLFIFILVDFFSNFNDVFDFCAIKIQENK